MILRAWQLPSAISGASKQSIVDHNYIQFKFGLAITIGFLNCASSEVTCGRHKTSHWLRNLSFLFNATFQSSLAICLRSESCKIFQSLDRVQRSKIKVEIEPEGYTKICPQACLKLRLDSKKITLQPALGF